MNECQRSFLRGQVFFCHLNNDKDDNLESQVIKGGHRVVVLFDSHFPSKMVTIVPISSSNDKEGNPRPYHNHYVKLIHADYIAAGPPYNKTIQNDSIIKTDQIKTIDRNDLESKKGEILQEDMFLLDLKMITTLGLKDTINIIIEKEIYKILKEQGAL